MDEGKTKERTYASKLKNDMSRNEAMRKKIRTGKANTKADDLKEKRHHDRLRIQGKKRRVVQEATLATARIYHPVVEENQDDNAAVDTIQTGSQLAENSLYSAKVKSHAKASSGYSKKMFEKKHMKEKKDSQKCKAASNESDIKSRQIQRNRMKKEMQHQANRKNTKDNASYFGRTSKRFVGKAEDVAAKVGKAVAEFVKSHPLEFVIAFLILIIILIIATSFTSCGAAVGGVSNITISTSFTAEDDVIVSVNNDYLNLERELQTKIDHIERDYPDYDEYIYSMNEISHNPFELAAILTVLYEDYTRDEVQNMLQTIKDSQYTLTKESIVETRTRIVTKWHWVTRYRIRLVDGVVVKVPYRSYESYEVEEEYQYYILNVTLINHSIDYVVKQMGLTEEELERYQLLLETYGNKKYLFEDDPYAIVTPGEYQDYKVPSEYLTDVEFGNMLHEAEKYLGYPYVWGGSSPSTSFDCSGFVSYVINHCGNGWDVGRQTANGLLQNSSRISSNNAKPGDLIFFQGTCETKGASHVGIYVGDGMMLHCGNPIQYASINSSYWQSHFYTFGRLNH